MWTISKKVCGIFLFLDIILNGFAVDEPTSMPDRHRNGIANARCKQKKPKEECSRPGQPGQFTKEEKNEFNEAIEEYKLKETPDLTFVENAWDSFRDSHPAKNDRFYRLVSLDCSCPNI